MEFSGPRPMEFIVPLRLAKQFNLKDEKGVLVGDVVEDSPAEKAGLQRGDVIIEFDGKEVNDPSNLRNMVANTPPNKEAGIKLLREGKQKEVKVTITELPAEMQKVSAAFDNQLKGVYIQDITPELRKTLNIPKRITGVIITDVEDGSPSDRILMKNDVILEINRGKIGNTKEYNDVASKIKPGSSILMLIYRSGSTIYITLPAR